MKRPVPPHESNTRYEVAPDDLAAAAPNLADFLTARFYDDSPGVVRATGTLLIFAQEGVWKACLRDRQEQRCLWVAAACWNDLVAVLEDSLLDQASVWRMDRVSGAETAKRIPHSRKPA